MILGNPKESGADLAVALVNTWDTYDAVVRAECDLAVVDEERVGHVAQPAERRAVVADDRLARTVRARHDQRPPGTAE